MRTSEEIYHRVCWDPRFDPARFALGIAERRAEPVRIPLPDFVPGGEIPWHRVLFIEADGEVVWDRTTGTDRIDASDAGRVRDTRRLRAPFFAARTPYVWDAAAGWGPADRASGAASPVAGLRVLTWDTLGDRYGGARIDLARRRRLLLAILDDADVDVIALQDVEPELLALLSRTRWVRAGYTLSTDPVGRDIADSGLLLLSRLPVREAGWHLLNPQRAVVAIVVDTLAGPLVVATTLLTGDRSDDGPDRRLAELTQLAEGLAGVEGDLILLGDFNVGGDGAAGPAAALGLWDAWTEVHGPRDRTPTLDPRVNPLAAASAPSGRAARLDRVLLRAGAHGTDGCRATRAALRGNAPTLEGMYPSDHYGVEVDLSLGGHRPAGRLRQADDPRDLRGAAQPDQWT
ncbi:RNA repair domain-containing protein [Streptomyces sp. SAJ15]|uniref:RNA repair domain-containing protein n=1 Tax=Streptomyces sp. SAJ15 TaxID=2011095 RepID=UPI00164301E8